MSHRAAVRPVALGLLLSTLAGCGGGSAASAIRPADLTYADAVGPGQCRAIDWPPEKRVDLEVAMRQGIPVVAYDCKSIRLLPECKVDGSYGFVGTTTKEQVIRLDNADELSANLP